MLLVVIDILYPKNFRGLMYYMSHLILEKNSLKKTLQLLCIAKALCIRSHAQVDDY